MAGNDVETQTKYRDSEPQSCKFDLIVPEQWQLARPNPWVLAGCPVGFEHGIRLYDRGESSASPLYARPKAKLSFQISRFVPPTKDKKPRNLEKRILEANRLILEPFLSSSYRDLVDLERRVSFRASNDEAISTAASVISEATSLGGNWLSRITQGLNKHLVEDYRPIDGNSQSNQRTSHRIYAAYLGRHGKILTPRCDPSLLGRMERSNAVVLLQRCLRGRAAQINMLKSRLRVLQLYPELNELDDRPVRTMRDTHSEEIGPIKALVQEQFYKMFMSVNK